MGRALRRKAPGGGAHHSEDRLLCKPLEDPRFSTGFSPGRSAAAQNSLRSGAEIGPISNAAKIRFECCEYLALLK
jgi:hypothetical protein